MRNQIHMKSQWSAITAQPNRGREKYRRHQQPDPETRAAEISSRSQLYQRVDHRLCPTLEVESVRREPENTVFQERTEIRSPERNPLENLDRNQWQHSPKKCRAPRPARDQQQQAVDRRMPER